MTAIVEPSRHALGTGGPPAWPSSRIVDADCHILEPPDIWDNWLPEKYQDKAPKLVKDHEGGDAWLTAVGGDPDPIGLVVDAGHAVRPVPLVRRHLRGGAHRLLQRRRAARRHGPSTACTPRSSSRRSAR